jgi:hypothetical protein
MNHFRPQAIRGAALILLVTACGLGSAATHPFDLLHVSLDIRLEYADRSYSGVVVNTIRPIVATESVDLHCGSNLELSGANCIARGTREEVAPPVN